MRTLTALLVTLCLVSAAYADYTAIDDFSTYTVGASVHGQGSWQIQRNSSAIGDTGYSTVIDVNGQNVVQLVNRDLDGGIDTVYAAFDLGVSLNAQDTLKVTFRSFGWNDTLMCTNALDAGWTDDGTGDIADGGQGCANYADQAAMVVLRSDETFRARDNGGYVETATQYAAAGTWYDLYMLIDSPNDQTIYAIAPAGADASQAVIVANPNGGDFWGHRNDSYDAAENLKFLCGGGAWPPPAEGYTEELVVEIAGISYMNGFDPNIVPEPATMSLLALGGLALVRRRRA